MADFKEALKILLQAEGPGGVIDPSDPGGLTVWGITREFEKTWAGWPRFDDLHKGVSHPENNGEPSLWYQDGVLISYVTDYYKQVWVSLLLEGLKSQVVANAFLGSFVNEGPKVVRWFQSAAGCTPDGAMGPMTIDAVNAAPCVWEKFSIQRLRYYNDTAQTIYLHGLFSRVLVIGA